MHIVLIASKWYQLNEDKPAGGAETFTLFTARALKHAGHDVTIIAPRGSYTPSFALVESDYLYANSPEFTRGENNRVVSSIISDLNVLKNTKGVDLVINNICQGKLLRELALTGLKCKTIVHSIPLGMGSTSVADFLADFANQENCYVCAASDYVANYLFNLKQAQFPIQVFPYFYFDQQFDFNEEKIYDIILVSRFATDKFLLPAITAISKSGLRGCIIGAPQTHPTLGDSMREYSEAMLDVINKSEGRITHLQDLSHVDTVREISKSRVIFETDCLSAFSLITHEAMINGVSVYTFHRGPKHGGQQVIEQILPEGSLSYLTDSLYRVRQDAAIEIFSKRLTELVNFYNQEDANTLKQLSREYLSEENFVNNMVK